MSVNAWALDLYGISSIWMPAIDLNSSTVMWLGVPRPEEAYCSLPALPCASAMNSFRFLTPSSLPTRKMLGVCATCVIGREVA